MKITNSNVNNSWLLYWIFWIIKSLSFKSQLIIVKLMLRVKLHHVNCWSDINSQMICALISTIFSSVFETDHWKGGCYFCVPLRRDFDIGGVGGSTWGWVLREKLVICDFGV